MVTIILKSLATNSNNNNNNVTTESQELTVDREEIVQFVSEGVIPSTDAVPTIVDISTNYKDMTLRESLSHDVKSFLRRPINIHSGMWDTTATAGTQLYTANFPETLIANSMYQEKLRGFVGLRATLVLQVQVNSQLFQQGNLMLQYIPYAQYLGSDRVDIVNASLSGRSGCPRSDLNIAVGTEINMRIPFVSPNLFFNLITGQGSFGSVYLVVYSPLFDEASGTGSIEYTIWAHLEDVEVEYPTGAEIYTGNEPNRFNLSNRLLQGVDHFDTDYGAEPAKIFAQIMPEIMAMKESGMISSTFGTISDGLNTLSTLPVVGKFLEAPSWISSQISNIAQIFGFSKPTSQSHACETKLRGQARMANYNGADMSHKLALSANNELETREGLAGTSVDEMAISTVASIPNYWQRFTWRTADSTGDAIYSDLVTANRCLPDSVTDGVFTTTHMGFLANVHTYWRGSIVYTFKFMKTKFHSGRLRIAFTPYHYGGTNKPIGGLLDISKCYQTVVDLRESTEVTFTVPYVSSRPWMFCTRPNAPWLSNGTANDFYLYNVATGMIRVEVLNKLVAASNVHQSIDVIVEVSGGPDITFAGPTAPALSIWGNGDLGLDRIVAQVMGENEVIQRNEAQLGNSPATISDQPIKVNWSPEALCIGEKIVSIRQLVKRFASVGVLTLNSTAGDVVISPYSVASPNRGIEIAWNYGGMFEYFYFIYAFLRGGMRLKASYLMGTTNQIAGLEKYHGMIRAGLFSSVNDQWNYIVNNNLIPAVGFTPAIAQSTNLIAQTEICGQSMQVIDPELEGLVEVEVPYYNISHLTPTSMTLNGEKPMTAENVWRGLIPPSLVTLSALGNFPAETNCRCEIFRACSDDFSFLYTLGVPRLAVPPLPTPPFSSPVGAVGDSIYTVD